MLQRYPFHRLPHALKVETEWLPFRFLSPCLLVLLMHSARFALIWFACMYTPPYKQVAAETMSRKKWLTSKARAMHARARGEKSLTCIDMPKFTNVVCCCGAAPIGRILMAAILSNMDADGSHMQHDMLNTNNKNKKTVDAQQVADCIASLNVYEFVDPPKELLERIACVPSTRDRYHVVKKRHPCHFVNLILLSPFVFGSSFADFREVCKHVAGGGAKTRDTPANHTSAATCTSYTQSPAGIRQMVHSCPRGISAC